MSKSKKLKWRLNPDEVNCTGMASSKSGRTKVRQSRALDQRSLKLTMVHEPTKLEATGKIPEGHYSRKKMRELHCNLRKELFSELEHKVARKLGKPFQ
tara:strand:+ start:99568 stop:99861 length:294 start_codon:yes stop_codon:yes gene_type:complete